MEASGVRTPSTLMTAGGAGGRSINDRSPSGRIQGSDGQKVRLRQYARKVDHECARC
jgi:Bacterial archaeo-eukaryotic release factor family 8